MLGHSFLSRNIPLRSIYSLVRMRAGMEERVRAPHRNFGHMLAALARRLHMNVSRNAPRIVGRPSWPPERKEWVCRGVQHSLILSQPPFWRRKKIRANAWSGPPVWLLR